MADRVMKDYFLISRNGGADSFCVELLHRANNMWAAKKAMLNTYGLKESDIITYGLKPYGTAYSTFDGTRYD